MSGIEANKLSVFLLHNLLIQYCYSNAIGMFLSVWARLIFTIAAENLFIKQQDRAEVVYMCVRVVN
jgi:hypothetical protein